MIHPIILLLESLDHVTLPSLNHLTLTLAKPAFTIDDLPDQTGRVAIVTGSNVGIGKETAKVLLQKNCKVGLIVLAFDDLSAERGFPLDAANKKIIADAYHILQVYVAARSEEKAKAAIEDLIRDTGKNNIHYLQLDLSDLTQVKKAAEEFKS